jgi:hypothetical protein
VLGKRSGIHRDEGRARSGPVVVKRSGDELLADAGLAFDQDACIARRVEAHLGADLPDRGAPADQPARRAPVGAEELRQGPTRRRESACILDDVVRGAFAEAFHGARRGRVCRQEDERHLATACAEPPHQVEAVTVGERAVDDGGIEPAPLDLLERVRQRGGGADP